MASRQRREDGGRQQGRDGVPRKKKEQVGCSPGFYLTKIAG